MAITAAAALDLIRNLNVKVREGRLSRGEAEKLAIAALQEVPDVEPDAAQAADEETPAVPEPTEEVAPTPAVDPKTAIMSRIADLHKAIESQWASFQQDISEMISGSAGEAFPLGDMKLNADKITSKIHVEKSDKQGAVTVKFSMDREWDVDGVNAPGPVEASVDATCHLNLRKEIVALTDMVVEATVSSTMWKRFNFPTKDFERVSKTTASAGDERANTIMKARPELKDGPDAWRQWGIAAQVYLLGPDYADAKSFRDVQKQIEAMSK